MPFRLNIVQTTIGIFKIKSSELFDYSANFIFPFVILYYILSSLGYEFTDCCTSGSDKKTALNSIQNVTQSTHRSDTVSYIYLLCV